MEAARQRQRAGGGGSSGGGGGGGGNGKWKNRSAEKVVGGRRQSQLSTDVSWQLAKDADGPDGKMKNTRKFGFSEYVKSDKKIGNLGNLKKSEWT